MPSSIWNWKSKPRCQVRMPYRACLMTVVGGGHELIIDLLYHIGRFPYTLNLKHNLNKNRNRRHNIYEKPSIEYIIIFYILWVALREPLLYQYQLTYFINKLKIKVDYKLATKESEHTRQGFCSCPRYGGLHRCGYVLSLEENPNFEPRNTHDKKTFWEGYGTSSS